MPGFASLGGFVGHCVFGYHGRPALGQSLDPLPQGLEQHVEARDHKDAEEARGHHAAEHRGADGADRRPAGAGCNDERHQTGDECKGGHHYGTEPQSGGLDRGEGVAKNIAAAMGSKKGKVILLEAVLSADGGPDFGKFLDMEMLLFPGEGHELSRSGRPKHRLVWSGQRTEGPTNAPR